MINTGEQQYELQSLIDWRNFFQRTEPIEQEYLPAIQRSEHENNPIQGVQPELQPIQLPEQLPTNNIPNAVQNPFGLTMQQMEDMDYIITMAFQQTRWANTKNKQIKKKKLSTKKVEVTSQCPICLENIKKSSRVPLLICKHEFHQKCLNGWMKKKQSCPLCRLDIASCIN